MPQGVKDNLPQRHTSVAMTFLVIVTLTCTLGCGGKSKKGRTLEMPIDSLPMMETSMMSSLISDSGIARYKIEAKEWLVFDKKDPSYWAFEKGLHLDQFDSLFTIEANIDCDTAYYYDKEELWKLMGNVRINNRKGEEFTTQLLYWDQRKRRVYSEEHIRIKQPDKIITGKGFDSNETFTSYVIHDIEGIFYVDEAQLQSSSPADSTLQSGTTLTAPQPEAQHTEVQHSKIDKQD